MLAHNLRSLPTLGLPPLWLLAEVIHLDQLLADCNVADTTLAPTYLGLALEVYMKRIEDIIFGLKPVESPTVKSK